MCFFLLFLGPKFYLINRMENMDPVWLCCTISLSKDITLSFLTANVSIKDAIVLS